jgi:hypothetical protein
MRRIISMPAAIIAALVMLAAFDSAARSDEQAQLLKVSETVWRSRPKNRLHKRLHNGRQTAPMPFVTEVILRSDSNPLAEGR